MYITQINSLSLCFFANSMFTIRPKCSRDQYSTLSILSPTFVRHKYLLAIARRSPCVHTDKTPTRQHSSVDTNPKRHPNPTPHTTTTDDDRRQQTASRSATEQIVAAGVISAVVYWSRCSVYYISLYVDEPLCENVVCSPVLRATFASVQKNTQLRVELRVPEIKSNRKEGI